MDRSWMYGPRNTITYLVGVNEFIVKAVSYQKLQGNDRIWCPCSICRNMSKETDVNQIRAHLFERGFRDNYHVWTFHGEVRGDGDASTSQAYCVNLKRKADEIASTINYGARDEDAPNHVDDSESDEYIDDRMDELVNDVQENFDHTPKAYASLMDAANITLCSGSTFSKLSGALRLYHLKAKHRWTNASFTELLEALQELFPGNTLPSTTYEARKLMCPMGTEIQKIHACPNDCILYRKEYENLEECPRCHVSRYKKKESASDVNKRPKNRTPAKVLWYLPIIPRFRRLFSNAKDSKLLVWHAENRKKDGFMRHVADAPQWKQIDLKYPEYGNEPRNLRLGLCTDGMNPHGTLSSQHSTWPVLLTIYNLPPWLSMKRKYIMLSLLISGPKQPGNDIDVFLAPLIDDLNLLHSQGVSTYDANTKTNFILRAMLYCTINDFPAYGNLSGYPTKGSKACPICEEDTIDLRLTNCQKNVFPNFRIFLPTTHRFRSLKKPFNGQIEKRVARLPLSGRQVYEKVKDLQTVFGKPYKPIKGRLWKKKSIFWELPYWKDLSVRHCLDVMHIEKNVCDAIVGTLLNIPGKSKDSLNVRKDMSEQLKMRMELAPQVRGKGYYLPPACYTLTKIEKKIFCECLYGIKVPSGYCSNIKNYVSLKDSKLVGMKSHDCHILMEHFLPVAIRGILPKHVRHAITRLCFFFNAISSKVIDPGILDELQQEVVVTLCHLEMYFPPSFFDIMVHLVVHLVGEIKVCGPLFLRSMWPFERHMGSLKSKVKNRGRPEGSIVRGVIDEEVLEFCTPYLSNVDHLGLPKSKHEGRLQGVGTIGRKKMKNLEDQLIEKAHLLVLQHLQIVHPYLEQHQNLLKSQNPLEDDAWLAREHNRTFASWFNHLFYSSSSSSRARDDVGVELRWLAYGPKKPIYSYEGYDINGCTFYTARQDEKSVFQNSGVTLVASSIDYSSASSYYGRIEEIWELDYTEFKFAIFRCKWVDNHRGVKHDEMGDTLVDFSRCAYRDDPFILASQAEQVFYIQDPSDHRWSIVKKASKKIVGIDGGVEMEANVDEAPSVSVGIPSVDVQREPSEDDLPFVSTHDEGLLIT